MSRLDAAAGQAGQRPDAGTAAQGSADGTPRRPGGPGRLLKHPLSLRILSLLMVLGVWEYQGRAVDSLFLTPPTDILGTAVDMVEEGALQAATLNSLYHLAIAFGIALVFGIVLGLLLGHYRLLGRMFDSFINAAYVAPHAAFAPLMLLWFGLGSTTKIVIISTAAVFPILINVQAGVHSIDEQFRTLSDAFCVSGLRFFTAIAVPATLSYTIVGVRIGLGRAVTNLVVAEFLTTFSGLGGLILAEANVFRTSRMFVGIIILMLIGNVLTQAVGVLENRLAAWRTTERASR